ncbi:MAG: hypothetical protein H5T65_13250 [Chloroflexi bacterium]|nr:hypothetical protein [Chloroflexota bacterium]
MSAMVGKVLAYGETRATRILGALSALALAAFLATIPIPRADGMLIGSDGIGYYMIVRSIALDHDLDFTNEVARLNAAKYIDIYRTPTGRISNQYAVGTPILWLPFFVAAHLLALALRAMGAPVAADGYGYIYQAAVCVGSIVYGSCAMVLMHRTARRLFPDTALAACVALYLASNFAYYLIAEPSMAHMCSVFAASVLLYLWLSRRPPMTPKWCFAIGVAGGLVGLVRQPDAPLLLLPALDALLARGPVVERARRLGAMAAGFLAVFWVQMLVWYILNGSPFLSGYLLKGDQGFVWGSPRVLEVLFSTRHGLFLWHPVLLLAVAGLVMLARQNPAVGALLLVGVAGQTYIIASWSAWWQGDAFGGRMFMALLPIFAIGLAAFLQGVRSRPGVAAASVGVIVALIVWNALFMAQYRLGFISRGGPYTLRELTWGKAEMVAAMVRALLR